MRKLRTNGDRSGCGVPVLLVLRGGIDALIVAATSLLDAGMQLLVCNYHHIAWFHVIFSTTILETLKWLRIQGIPLVHSFGFSYFTF
jgi:hypothetical protein